MNDCIYYSALAKVKLGLQETLLGPEFDFSSKFGRVCLESCVNKKLQEFFVKQKKMTKNFQIGQKFLNFLFYFIFFLFRAIL